MINTKKIVLSSLIALGLFGASASHAIYENDLRLTAPIDALPNFAYPQDYIGSKNQQPGLDDEIRIYFEQQYHPVAIMYYAMRSGMSVRRVKEIADNAGIPIEYLNRAQESLQQILPGGVCNGGYLEEEDDEKPGVYSLSNLKNQMGLRERYGFAGDREEPTITDVISKYFNNNEVLSVNQSNPNLSQIYSVNWQNAADFIPYEGVPAYASEFVNSGIPAHIGASADDLLDLVNQSNDYWFFQEAPAGQGQINAEDLSDRSPILVFLYRDQKEAIVSPWQVDRIMRARANNERLPVMFFFDGSNVRPVSQIAQKMGFQQIVSAYINRGIKVAAVPSWEQGNYHTLATSQQLSELFNLPSRNEIPNARYTKALATIDNGMPLHVAIVGGKLFLGDPDRAVAMIVDGQYNLLPINFIFIDVEPAEDNFNMCENAFNGPYGLAFPFGPPPNISGVVIPCTPRIIDVPRTIDVSPNGTQTIIDRITVPCIGGVKEN